MDSIDFSNIDEQRKYNINLYKKINTGKHLYHKICNTRKIGAGGSKKQVFTGVQCDNTPLLIPQDSLQDLQFSCSISWDSYSMKYQASLAP